MVAADRQAVAVAGDDDDRQIGPRELQPGREGERPAVRGVEGVGVDIGADAARAADARDHRELVLVDAQLVHRPQQRAQRDAVAAAGAHEMRHHLQPQIVLDVEGRADDAHSWRRAPGSWRRSRRARSARRRCGSAARPCRRAGEPLDFERELAGVHLRHQHAARPRRRRAHSALGERPQGDRPEQAGLDPLRRAGRRRRGAPRARRCRWRRSRTRRPRVAAPRSFRSRRDGARSCRAGAASACARQLRLLGRKALGGVGQAGDVDAKAVAGTRHRRNEILGLGEGRKSRSSPARPFALRPRRSSPAGIVDRSRSDGRSPRRRAR